MRCALFLLLATTGCTTSDPVIDLHWADNDADCTNVHIHVEGSSLADVDQSCGFCLDLGGGCNGYDYKFSLPDGSTGVVVTTQVTESGDDPDDHPPPTTFELDSPLHADATYEVPI